MRHHNHQYPSPEKLSNITLILRDVIIGFADGLTVPFALTAGLSSLGSSKLVVIGGLAELLSGTISMGMGAYLAVITERDRYIGQEMLLRKSVSCRPEDERTGIIETLNGYGISREAGESVIACLVPEDILTKFIMEVRYRYRKPKQSRAWFSAITMGLSYFIGGLLPMIPYFTGIHVTHALFISIGITVATLLFFGFIKNYIMVGSKRSGFYGAIQTLSVGVIAGGASYGIVYGIDHSNIK